jgi:hypothetical protein
MTTVLLGSSMAKCSLGFNWTKSLKQPVLNLGMNNALLKDVYTKQIDKIPSSEDIAAVIIIVGGNDYKASFPDYKLSTKQDQKMTQLQHLGQFKENADRVIKKVRMKCPRSRIGFVNLKPLCENLQSPLNERIVMFNEILAQVVSAQSDSDIVIIDLYSPIFLLLEQNNHSPTSRKQGINDIVSVYVMIFAALKHALFWWLWSFDDIGKSFGYTMSCDGLHWNETSGKVMADLAKRFINA